MTRPRLLLLLTAALPALIITSCTKHDHHTQTGTLVLRPDSTTGQDTYVSKVDDYTDGDANLNFAHELTLARWTYSQFNEDSGTQRSYIRFDSLSKIPSKAKVSSAILYLYGESTSPSYPYGNSYFPGSSYPLANTGLVQRVVGGTWDQKTITWNNAPALTSDGQDTIQASTSQYNYNTSVDVTNLVQLMVSSPSTNYGFGLRLATEKLWRALEFSTCEATDSTLRPKLVVSYSYEQ